MDLLKFLDQGILMQEALDAQSKASSVQTQLLELRREHEQLKLLTRALWSLLKETQGLTDADLRRHLAVQEGAKKKAATAQYWNCPECRHQVPQSVKTCPYCGHQSAPEDTL
jgi:hypothetical protein